MPFFFGACFSSSLRLKNSDYHAPVKIASDSQRSRSVCQHVSGPIDRLDAPPSNKTSDKGRSKRTVSVNISIKRSRFSSKERPFFGPIVAA